MYDFPMPLASHPPVDRATSLSVPGGDDLAAWAKPVTGGGCALNKRASVQSNVTKVVVVGHVLAMFLGSNAQCLVECDGWTACRLMLPVDQVKCLPLQGIQRRPSGEHDRELYGGSGAYECCLGLRLCPEQQTNVAHPSTATRLR